MKLLLKKIKTIIFKPYYLAKFKADVKNYEEGRLGNSVRSYYNMVNAFCATGGSLHRDVSNQISKLNPIVDLNPLLKDSIFSPESIDFDVIDKKLNQDGFYVFPQRLDGDLVGKLLDFAKSTPCKTRAVDTEKSVSEDLLIIDENSPQSIIYQVPEEKVINNPIVQKIVSDYIFLKIAQNYLRVDPILDICTLWWSTNFSAKSDKNAAQWYHFDMDRIKWLKVFIYLTDVGPDNGPHTFVKNSSMDGGIPMGLLSKGYNRLSDNEVMGYFNKSQIIEFTGLSGTIIFEDTRGLHKGRNVTGSPRCLFQFQFCNSLFGAAYSRVNIEERHAGFINQINSISKRFLSRYR